MNHKYTGGCHAHGNGVFLDRETVCFSNQVSVPYMIQVKRLDVADLHAMCWECPFAQTIQWIKDKFGITSQYI
jgi:predicted 3-demethylubiquinone-9 3-methyltransferase (glyoxalase superfamily)